MIELRLSRREALVVLYALDLAEVMNVAQNRPREQPGELAAEEAVATRIRAALRAAGPNPPRRLTFPRSTTY